MLFFDNEMRNCRDVGRLGVTSVYTPDGMTERTWQQGLTEFAQSAEARLQDGSSDIADRQKYDRTPIRLGAHP